VEAGLLLYDQDIQDLSSEPGHSPLRSCNNKGKEERVKWMGNPKYVI